jgi:6-phosphogluconolactonase
VRATGTGIGMAGLGKLNKEEELQVYPNVEELSVSLAAHVADVSASAVEARGGFSVVLSGGSLIKTLSKLCESPYLETVDWARWHVFWADERVVKKDHPDSNYKLAWDGLLSKVPIPSGQVYAINDTLSTEAAAEDYEMCIKQLTKTGIVPTHDGYPRFDLLLLGMGPDGHCCSLFPHHPLVHVKDRWIAPITDSPKPPPERITFTLPVVQAAANITFVANGEGKAEMMAKVFGEELPLGELPSQSARPLNGKLIWFADKPAASKL